MKNLSYSGEEILETIQMVRTELLDIRTITIGISLLDCVSNTTEGLCAKIYDKVTGKARDLRKVGLEIEQEYGIPIVNYRVSAARSRVSAIRTKSSGAVRPATSETGVTDTR